VHIINDKAMVKIRKIEVLSKEITVILNKDYNDDYICLTDMVKGNEGDDHIRNWMRNKNTIEFLGVWEKLHNPKFKGVEFDTFLNEAGFNRFNMTPKKWIEATNAIGILSKPGRNGGTFAHKDIAFNFCMWISPTFQLYIVQEYQRLRKEEENPLLQQWDVKRILSKVNYSLHTDAVKNYIIPRMNLSKYKESIIYASEADMLNLILFGFTAKSWEEANPKLVEKKLNIRDMATINQLIVLSNMESLNAELIKREINKKERFAILHKMAKEQLRIFDERNIDQKFRKLSSGEKDNK
jgi:hypothetical protein